MNTIIAVDFDGTLCENKFPEIGDPKTPIIESLIQCKKNGATLILWSCRCGELLEKAWQWCAERGLIFEYVNENPPEIISRFGSETRKIFADIYLDDRALSPLAFGAVQENEALKKELAFTRKYIHDNGLEFDLMSKYINDK